MQDTIKPIDLQVVKNECANRIDFFLKDSVSRVLPATLK
jgi:hypothetical protein